MPGFPAFIPPPEPICLEDDPPRSGRHACTSGTRSDASPPERLPVPAGARVAGYPWPCGLTEQEVGCVVCEGGPLGADVDLAKAERRRLASVAACLGAARYLRFVGGGNSR